MQNKMIEGFRLSPLQRQLWRGQQGRPAFRAQCLVTLDGALDAGVMERSLAAVVGRHEILRTTFDCLPGMEAPLQVIAEAPGLSFETVDLTGLDGGARDETVVRLFREEAGRPFDFAGGPLAHFKLMKLSADGHALLVSLPAMCADSRTLKNLVGDLSQVYATLLEGGEPAADEEALQYVQFSEWHNEILEGEEADAGRAFWDAQRLADIPAPALPLEEASRPESADGGFAPEVFAPEVFVSEVDADLARRVEGVAERLNVSSEALLLACWQLLLWRLGGGDEAVVVESLFGGRKYEELSGALGLFANYLPVPLRVEARAPFSELARRAEQSVNDAAAHQEYYTRESAGGLDPALSIKFEYDTQPEGEQGGGVRFALARQYVCLDRFRLKLCATDTLGSLLLELHYDPASIGAGAVRRLAGAFRALVCGVADDPETAARDLNVLGEDERGQVLFGWNRTRADYRADICLHQLFEEQAARTPEATAVVYEDSRLTFAELNGRANQLARRLRGLGVGPEVRVGLCMSRSAEMLVGLLGILKAGGAYLPLDPAYPAERLAFMLEDGRAEVLLTQESLLPPPPSYAGRVVCIDRDAETFAGESTENLAPSAEPDNLAYVIYTSGSTGRPKGVMIRHRSVLNLVAALNAAIYDHHPSPLRVSVNAPLAFDGSVKQLVQVASGHALYIVPEEIRPDGAAMLSFIERQRLDVLDCTPSQLRLLLDAGMHERPGCAPAFALVGGEALDQATWDALAASPSTVYYNVYGPTECTVDTTVARVGPAQTRPNIGRPIANVEVYILDDALRPAAVGVAGELYVGGGGVARGYLGRPALTAERFVPHPFSAEAGARLYRTGDLARWREDGAVEFIGRADNQVKVRGLRIELGEIESVMARHPAVGEVVVLAREDTPGDQRLVAYVVPGRGHAAEAEGPQRYRLPNGMAIAHHNVVETNYIYREIFEDRAYMKHGIRLPEGACVFDVGANVGLFTLFVTRNCPGARVYAFEPIGPIFDNLRANCGLYSRDAKLFDYGLSHEETTASFTYYPEYSTRSGLTSYADASDEVDVIKKFLQNRQEGGDAEVGGLLSEADDLFAGFFNGSTEECRLRRLSDVIREQGVGRIDLLKVDVQRAELDVLRGIDEDDWDRIDQVVMEVHDADGQETQGRVEEILGLLKRHGFEALAEQDELLRHTDRYNIYAVRQGLAVGEVSGDGLPQSEHAPARAEAPSDFDEPSTLSGNELREYVRGKLPDYMVPSAVVVLDSLPLNRNGKVDRHALPAPSVSCESAAAVSEAPAGWYEQVLAGLWEEVLRVEGVGRESNFFELGGHSLLATQLVSRVREAFGVEMPLRALFESPTVAGLARRVAEARGTGDMAPAMVAGEGSGELSFAQQRLWFLHQLEPDNPFYNCPGAVRLMGSLNFGALEQTINEVVRRHEVLRSTFQTVDGEPVQHVTAFKPFSLSLVDLSALPEQAREAEVRCLARAEAQRPFDLARGPVLRVELLRLAADQHILLFTMHHIVSDGWSMGILLREVSALYNAFSEGGESPLADLPVQYADYAVWQRGWLRGEVLERHLAYWRGQLSGAPPLLELPTDRPRPAVQTFRGAVHSFPLPAELTRRLKELSRREGVTLFMTLLAAFKVLLWRYTGQADISVGTDVAGRDRAETEGLIGFFVNQLVLRTDMSGDPSFRDLLRRVREVCLGAYQHQGMPFERLVEELNPERSLSHSPLFQVSFDMDYGRGEGLELGGLSAGGAGGGEARWSKYDLTLGVAEAGASAGVAFEYNTDLFDQTTIQRMASHLVNLLEAVARDPEQGVAALPMMSEEEERRLLVEFNETAADYPRELCLHQLFEAQAERTPDAEAVSFGPRRLTYAELDARSNQLAHHLRSLGVGAESLVAVLLERSEQMVVAVLAVLKAGGAYVPLDPAYPHERLRFMLEDSGAGVLVTQASLADTFGGDGVAVVCVDTDAQLISSSPATAPASSVRADNVAYAIYTSGSTGRPKGSLVEHSALVNYALMTRSRLGLTPADRFLQFASFSFDVFVEEVFPALSAGACVVMCEAEEMMEVGGLTALIGREGVTACELPAAYWHEWVRWMCEQGRVPPTSLRAMLVGCEKPSPERVGQWAEFGVRLVQVFGLTETAITTTIFEPREEATGEWRWQADRELPIGRPVENARVYVLDAEMRPTPVGVSGELYIGGDGLGRGYLNRPGLTAERFVPDPFDAEGGGRLYKTGDVVRHLACGELELLGRLDEQVKVRGFRVELGEIEAALQSHACVRECTVMARDSGHGDKRLVAYVVAEGDGAGAGAAELRAHLKGRLPEYMAPSAFVFLDAMPLTANGKIDRRALPEPSEIEKGAAADYVAAGTPAEELLADVWSHLLAVERVGVNDNFFELGGHSLLAMQLVSRVREAFGVDVPLRTVFESPTVAELAACVERMTAAGVEKQSAQVTAVPRGEGLQLSFAQERLWFLDQLEPDSPFYNVASAVRLGGPLDLRALERTLGEVVRRHEVLRTSFTMVGGSPVQRVSAPEPLSLPVVDLSALPEEERIAEARRLSGEESRLPFNLSEGPMLRALLVKLAGEDHVLALTMHHIVSDAWSINILVREVTTLYSAYSRGEQSPLPEPQVQYADFAHWQRGWLQGEVLEGQLDYWRGQLSGAPPVLELPTDRPRPAVQTYRGALHIFSLSPELTQALNDLGRREGATLFMTLLAGFQALMHRYTHQDDIVVGTPIAGRNRLETEDLIGFFVNTLVLRTRLSGRTTFRGLLKEVREVTLGAYQHQDVPFEKLVEELQPERDLSRQPLFQVMFSLQNASAGGEELPGIKLSPFGADNSAARFDITLEMNEFGGRLGGALRYNVDLFDEGTIRRMVEHFTRLLEAAALNPGGALSELTLLGEAERRQLLEGWNDTATGYPHDLCVHELFEEQALRTPDGVALACGELGLTYRQLDERSNQLARYLRKMGVGLEVRVGVCLPRSVELVVSLLAVMKAGGVYVPLDPTYPLERLAVMLEDAQSPVLVTDEEGLDSLPSQWGQVVCVDSDWEAISRELKGPIGDIGMSEDNLAYVIYTSGSTGRPKGVAVTHKGITRLVKNTNYIELTPSNKVAQVSNTSFDAATFEIWGSLLNGGQLVLVSRDASLSAQEMAEQIREHGISTMFLTTALFNQIAREVPQAFSSMKEVLFGGEAVDVRRVREVLSAGGPRRLLHVYGPTESTTFATWHEVSTVGEEAVTIPIGRPLSNTTAYVLDAWMSPVPVGVSGELYIGGDGLARGYLNHAALTAERFVPDPSGVGGGGRLYKTGDVVRQLPDGGIEFIGRADYQVKVRGFRIELGEIEAAIQSHAGVSECVVVARESEGGDKRLVAYVVVREGADGAGAAELRAHLKDRLPEYMVPSAFVTLEAMPLTPNGKIDRRALPEPGAVREACEEQALARTPVEEVLAGIWSQLLGVEGVGVNENFFELGGHSLLATQLVSRIRETFGVDVPLRAAFERPTIAELAEAVETAIRAEDGIELSPIVSAPRELPLPLSFSQQRLWFIDRFEPGTAAYNVPAAVRLRGRLDVDALEQTFGELLRRHESLRTTFAEADGQPVQVIRPVGPLRLPVTDLRGLPEVEREDEARRLATQDARLPFDLAQGPLLRAGLIRLDAEDHVVLFTMHHIVSDGWSIGVLVREIAALYAAFTKGEESPLAEPPIQYADFAVWQREWLQGEVLEAELRYWKQHLAGAPALLRLPTDRPRPAVQGYSGASQPFMLPEELSAKLKRLCRAEGVTLYMTLLAAFKTLLYRHSGERDIVIGTPIAGRNRTDIEGLIGFFVNTLVIRTKLSAELTFVELLRNVREATLGAYAHQDLPFEKLVEELQPERDMGHTPLFQVMFVLQNAPREAEELPDLKMTNFVSQETTAKFDLTLNMVESGERIGGTLEYNTDLFDDSTAARLLRHFARLLESIAARPEVGLADLELLSEEENELLEKATDVEELGESFSF